MPAIERVAKRVAKLLNGLSPESAVYAHTMLGAELIGSLIEDGDTAIELSKHLQRTTERELRKNPKYAGQMRVN
ncbi:MULTISPECIES: hypothetical protein [Mesorhizobium]|uniref:Uncharacterized protein n=1 Tax=Mesorhizobium temperatum TaxID=241416 RepID=A0A271LP04_9HYPH|nr:MULTISPECIES: hypothetical protein [Mesorhizobium]PAQ09804.1 hypothetical protein CIT26_11035 [Mesorhizobium temperatum]